MNKGLEALKELLEYIDASNRHDHKIVKIYERLEIIEKELKDKEKTDKALEIIKEEEVDVVALKISINLEQYNCKEDGRHPLTQEEYDLLKEVLL